MECKVATIGLAGIDVRVPETNSPIGNYFLLEDVESIALTGEILEKNGCIRQQQTDGFIYQIQLDNDKTFCLEELRMCGLHELVDNFKIK